MKKISFSFLALLFLQTVISNAQSIHFTSPTNGQVVTGTGYGSTESSIPVFFSRYYNTTPYPPRTSLYSAIKLITHNTTYDSRDGDIPQWFYLASNTYSWRLELWEFFLGGSSWEKTAEQTITFYVKYNIQSLNNFGGGVINVDGQQRSHGYTIPKLTGEVLQVGAIDQEYYYTDYVWNQSGINNSFWQRKGKNQNQFFDLSGATTRSYNYTAASNDNGAQIQAGMRKIVEPNFQNSFVGVGNGGVIKVNNTQYNSPTIQFDVVELNPISATALYQAINEIGYSFHHWNDNSTTATKTFNPGVTETYTAYYTGKPLTTNRALHTGTVYNQPIVLYWNEHPNTNVTQYQIWRRVKHNGVMSDPQIIATVNRGTTSYVDDEYNLTRNYSNDLLYYDVRPYYSTENIHSDPNWLAVYGVLMPKTSDSTITSTPEFENSLSNFPNPFNPTTNIKYSIKESGQVSIKVFDLIGQQIIELVNEEKAAGNYSILFDASQLPSGVYIYTIQSGNFFSSKKLILLK